MPRTKLIWYVVSDHSLDFARTARLKRAFAIAWRLAQEKQIPFVIYNNRANRKAKRLGKKLRTFVVEPYKEA